MTEIFHLEGGGPGSGKPVEDDPLARLLFNALGGASEDHDSTVSPRIFVGEGRQRHSKPDSGLDGRDPDPNDEDLSDVSSDNRW